MPGFVYKGAGQEERHRMLGLIFLLLALWLACEICAHDLSQPPPPDPYRSERWRAGEKP